MFDSHTEEISKTKKNKKKNASDDIHTIIDKSLETSYDIQTVWKITEIALMCVKPSGMERPSISEILKEIEKAILIEQKALTGRVEPIDIFARQPIGCHPPKFDISDSAGSDITASYTESFMKRGLR